MSLYTLLSQTCTIQRWAPRQPDSIGHVGPPAWNSVALGVRCNIQHHGARYMQSEEGRDVMWNATGYFLPGTDIRCFPGQQSSNEGDRVLLTEGGSQGTYKVVGVLDQAGKGRMLTVALEVV